MTNSVRIRSVQQVADDMLWPSVGLNEPDPEQDRRRMAAAEVLCRVPEAVYQKLTEMVDEFLWFVPAEMEGAKVHPFPWTVEEEGLKPYAKVLY